MRAAVSSNRSGISGEIDEKSEGLRNKTQEERTARDGKTKKLANTPQMAGDETWENPSGHSGTRRAWAVSVAMIGSGVGGFSTFRLEISACGPCLADGEHSRGTR
jgi:hypothetical protein